MWPALLAILFILKGAAIEVASTLMERRKDFLLDPLPRLRVNGLAPDQCVRGEFVDDQFSGWNFQALDSRWRQTLKSQYQSPQTVAVGDH